MQIQSLSEYLSDLDAVIFNNSIQVEIEENLIAIRDRASGNNDQNEATKAQWELKAIWINKSILEGLNPRLTFKGSPQNEGMGKWPDVDSFPEEQYAYLLSRYSETKNLFLKTEYGLLLYHIAPSFKRDDSVLELTKALFELCAFYWAQYLENDSGFAAFAAPFLVRVNDLFHLVRTRKNRAPFNAVFPDVQNLILRAIDGLSSSNDGAIGILGTLTSLIKDNFSAFSGEIDFARINEKLDYAIDKLSSDHPWGGIELALIAQSISVKNNENEDKWKRKRLKLYKALSQKAEKNGDAAAVSFFENALSIAKELKDPKEIALLEEKFAEAKAKLNLGEVWQEFPQESNEALIEEIKTNISELNSIGLIGYLTYFPWIPELSEIEKLAEESLSKSMFLSSFPAAVVDKMGHTIEKFDPRKPEEALRHAFLHAYGFYFQFASQAAYYFFLEAFKKEKLNAEIVLSYLKQTWIGEPFTRVYSGREHEIIILSTLEGSIRHIFNEFERGLADKSYQLDLVSAIDSLALKSEHLLRYFCEKLNVPTYYSPRGKAGIKMEVTFNELIDKPDIDKNLVPEDHFFMKFLLIEKFGPNLRNRIAHGMLDTWEYSVEYAVLLLVMVFKFAQYRFQLKEDDHDHSSSPKKTSQA